MGAIGVAQLSWEAALEPRCALDWLSPTSSEAAPVCIPWGFTLHVPWYPDPFYSELTLGMPALPMLLSWGSPQDAGYLLSSPFFFFSPLCFNFWLWVKTNICRHELTSKAVQQRHVRESRAHRTEFPIPGGQEVIQ